MNAQKFGHSVGQFFKKIDRTLSFLPEKPRKVAVATAALAVSPVLAGIIISKAKASNVNYDSENNNIQEKEPSLLAELLKDNSPKEEDGWEYGLSGYGYYIDGMKICGYDDDDEDLDGN